jgi:hypothetical protein
MPIQIQLYDIENPKKSKKSKNRLPLMHSDINVMLKITNICLSERGYG